jgi:short-subunit dehydrogenase
LDLQDLDSVVECVNEFKKMKIPLDILINNAGVGKPNNSSFRTSFEQTKINKTKL